MRKLTLLLLLLVSNTGFSQSIFSAVDRNSKSVPDSLHTAKQIATHLVKYLETDKEKARALYIWISHNIKYDLDLVDSDEERSLEEVLYFRKGVCRHYTGLFHEMSQSVGLKSYFITGYTKDRRGKVAEYSHAWNGIIVDSDYLLIDATWAAGHVSGDRYIHFFKDDYFLVKPKEFLVSHMPFDPIWQFIDNPITNEEFIEGQFGKLTKSGHFAFADSIQSHEKLEELPKLERENRRILRNGLANNLVQEKVRNNRLRIEKWKSYQETKTAYDYYNQAVDTLNTGIGYYNLYLSYKRRKFRKPKLTDVRLREIMDYAYNGVYTAHEILKNLHTTDTQLSQIITEEEPEMYEFLTEVEKEKQFVDRYLRTSKKLRIFTF